MVRRGFANKTAVASRVAPLVVLGCLAFGSATRVSAQTADILASARAAAKRQGIGPRRSTPCACG